MADDDGHDQDKERPSRGRGQRSSLSRGGGDRFAGPWWAAGECPDRRTFAAFLDKRLPPQHHQRLISHITDCETCSHSFLAVAAAVLDVDAVTVGDAERALAELDGPDEGVSSTPAPPPAWRKWLRSASFVAVLAAILSTAVGFLLGRWLPTRDPRVLLTSTVPPERPYAARFTGGMPWSRAAAPRHSPHHPGLNLSPGAISYLAAAELRGPAREIANAGELGEIGSAQVLGGRIDSGIETLARAVAAEPESAELLSDLGAALLARAESSEPGELEDDSVSMGETHDADIPAAIELIGRALEGSPHLQEALFNRALALERLYLRHSARKAWQQYLEVDASSPWSAEARARLAAIVVPAIPDPNRVRAEIAAVAGSGDHRRLAELVLSHRQVVRRTVQEDLLPGWAEAWLAGDMSEAGRRLAAAQALAAEWEAQTTDPTLVSAVGELERADTRQRDRLAHGYRAFGPGARALAVFDVPTAEAAADRALRAFPAESTAATWAQVLRLGCVYAQSGNVEVEAQPLLRAVASDTTSRGRVLWLLGLWRGRRGQYSQALATYRDALAAYSRAEEREPAVWLQGIIAEWYGYMGVSGLSWQHRRAVAREVAALRDRTQVSSFLSGSATSALAERRPRVAAVLLDEALAVPGAMTPEEAVPALVWRSRVRLTLGDRRGANDDFDRASTWFQQLGGYAATFYAPDLRMLRGLLAGEPTDAIAAFSEAIDGFRASRHRHRLPEVLLARAQAQQRARQYEAADDDLRQAAVLHDEQQQDAGQLKPLWEATLGEPDRLFDERVRLALKQGRSDEAFAVAEAARAGALRGTAQRRATAFAARGVEPLRLADLRSRLEPGVTMLVFAVLPDQVVQWRIEQHRSSVARLPISPRELARSVSVLETDLAAGAWTDASREHARRLYAALIGPARLGVGQLVVVPNGALHRVPFAVLLEPATQRFLIEERLVTVAPSATAYVNARDHERRLGQAPPVDALVVGEPQLSSNLFPGMHRLSGARAESRAVAALYPRRELLLGGAATRSAFVRSLGRGQVVHFAGHVVNNPVIPDHSSLLLSEDGSAEGPVLYGSDIAALDLGRTATVVLSGCNAGGSRTLDGEVPLSLARAFLAAGVPNVVASLWPLPAQQSAPLVTAFHRQLRNGERAAAALRSAQLAMLRGARTDLRSPAIWASFQAYGG